MIVFLCDINTYVENDNMIETLDCMESFGISEKFKGLTEECQERCFLALRQLQRRKVKHFFIKNIKIYALYKYLTFYLYCSAKYIVVHMFVTLPVKEIQFISI